MTQKFPFDHFLKLDNLNDVQPALQKTEMPVSPVIIENWLEKFISNCSINAKFFIDNDVSMMKN